MRRISFLPTCLATLWATCFLGASRLSNVVADEPPAPQLPAGPAGGFECRFASGPIEVDGRAEEAAWRGAATIQDFSLPWLRPARPARTATRARLLWDREHLYFFADLEDSDLYADIREHDGETWHNDVFELFFKPDERAPGYYEFQVNAAGAVFDLFLPRRGAGGTRRFVESPLFHLESRVALRGTLNKWQDRDEGWSVEGRIPWTDFAMTGGRPEVGEVWRFALCRYDYSVDFEGPELSTCAPLKSLERPDFHHHEDYASLRFVGPPPGGAVGGAAAARRAADDKELSPLDRAAGRILAANREWRPRVVGSPDPPAPYQVERVLPAVRLEFPVFVVPEPGSRRLLVIDQRKAYGTTRLARVHEPGNGEQGGAPPEVETLLEFPEGGVAYSLAFHPHFADNGWLYVGWNGPGPADDPPPGTRGPGDEESSKKPPKRSYVTRYTVGREAPWRLDPESATAIIDWQSDGHNGAAVAFGADGMLYVTSGDGTSDSDTHLTGQGLEHLLAKVLRIDVDRPAPGKQYSVPADNPFVGVAGARGETWAYGLRNPWRITVDAVSGQVWVGNNGQDLWEQAYLIERGANYGWSVFEGSHEFYPNRQLGPTPHRPPTFEHPHSESRSLTGGVVYRGDRYPELRGAYIYGDYSTGKIWGGRIGADGAVAWHRELADSTLAISAIVADPDGELWIVDHRGGDDGGLYTLVANPDAADPTLAARFPRKLSETGLFASVAEHRPHPGLIPYEVNSPLWSDNAHKERYLYLATNDDGAPLPFDLTDERGWNLADGTIAVKSFALERREGDPTSRQWVETRLLVRQEGEWVGYSYRWNEDQDDAQLVDAGGADGVWDMVGGDGANRTLPWRFPSRTECMVCHSRAANYVLGLSTLQFNRRRAEGDGDLEQLALLERLGALRTDYPAALRAQVREQLEAEGVEAAQRDERLAERLSPRGQRTAGRSTLLPRSPDQLPRLADPRDGAVNLTARVKSYLHANCAHCHVGAGGGNAQIDLANGTALRDMQIVEAPPLHHRFGLTEPRLVAPGAPERSVLLHRLSIRGPGQMPQLASARADEAAVELFRAWIASLPVDP